MYLFIFNVGSCCIILIHFNPDLCRPIIHTPTTSVALHTLKWSRSDSFYHNFEIFGGSLCNYTSLYLIFCYTCMFLLRVWCPHGANIWHSSEIINDELCWSRISMFVPGVSQSAKSRRSFAIVLILSKLNGKISLLYSLNNYFYSLLKKFTPCWKKWTIWIY